MSKVTVIEVDGLVLKHKRHKAFIVEVENGEYDIRHEVRCKCGTIEVLRGIDG